MSEGFTLPNVNFPSRSVVVPLVVPFTTTLTPGSSPMASTTLPLTWPPVCACIPSTQQKSIASSIKVTFCLININLISY